MDEAFPDMEVDVGKPIYKALVPLQMLIISSRVQVVGFYRALKVWPHCGTVQGIKAY